MGIAAGIVWMKERWATAQHVSLSVNNVFHLFKGTWTKMSDRQQQWMSMQTHTNHQRPLLLYTNTCATPLRLNRTHMQYTPELYRTAPSSEQINSIARHTRNTITTHSTGVCMLPSSVSTPEAENRMTNRTQT